MDFTSLISIPQEWLEIVFSLFKEPDVARLLAGSILIVGLIALILVCYKFLCLKLAIVKSKNIIEQGTPDNIKSLSMGEQKRSLEAAFAENFDVEDGINQRMNDEKLLHHVWSEYGETFVYPNGADDDTIVIRNTLRPDHYFNLKAVTHGFMDLGFWRALPNWFVGVGLILTFVGLAAALYTASQNLATDAQGALTDLLNIATVKFTTSVAGLLCSLILSISIRIGENIISSNIAVLCHTIERRLRVITQEDMAYKQLQELQEQKKQLEEFNQTFAIQLADALEKKFSQSVGAVFKEALSPLNETIDRITRSAVRRRMI